MPVHFIREMISAARSDDFLFINFHVTNFIVFVVYAA